MTKFFEKFAQILGKKVEDLEDINFEIRKVDEQIAEKQQLLDKLAEVDASDTSMARRASNELNGLKDKLAVLQGKKRHEEEKAGHR